MSIVNIVIVLLAGITAGFINTLAGGGSLITLPLLIALGLPSAVANGTNRIALMVENISAIGSFKKRGYFNYRLGITLGIPAIFGAILGSHLAINLPESTFNRILAFTMLIMLALIIWNPTGKYKGKVTELSVKRKNAAILIFFLIGIYGGFIQAGVGIIIITALSLITGLSLVKINNIKVFVIAFYLLSSLIIFIIKGNVNWFVGLILAIGNGTGAWLASSMAVKRGEIIVKIILIIAVLLLAGNLLGIKLPALPFP
ncbi:MAG: sulfite exporter TauE/SafE family protein [Halanaerobiaceae bacterium]